MKTFEILISIIERYDKNSKFNLNCKDLLSFNHKIDFSIYGRIDKKIKNCKKVCRKQWLKDLTRKFR